MATVRIGMCMAFVLAAFCASSPAGPEVRRFEYRKVVMGTEARLVLFAEDEDAAKKAAAAAFARLEEIDEKASDYRPDSEIARLPERAAEGPVPVSRDLAALLAAALEVARASRGAFDPTVGPLTALWRRARDEGVLPSDEEVERARESVGFEGVVLDEKAGTVRFASDRIRLDLGGIAKGYAAEQAFLVLERHGFARSLVDLGGDLYAGDPPPGREGWSVRVGCDAAGEVWSVRRRAVCTSGDTEQYVEVDGVRHSHIVDPRTGRATTTPLCATVCADDGARADALASAILVLGRREGRVLARSLGVELFLLDRRFRDLFDGRTLTGFTTKGGRYDGAARFTVEDGCIVGRVGPNGEGGLLYTEEAFTSFDFECEVMTEAPFDSGIFLRMRPDLRGWQVTLDDRPGGEIAAIYSDGFLQHNETARERWRSGRFVHVEVRMTGFDPRIEVWLDGLKVADYRQQPGLRGFAPVGRIGLQVHDASPDAADRAVRFRRLRIRELPVFADVGGFHDLIPADDLEAFSVIDEREDAYRLEDEGLALLNFPGSGLIATSEDYGDFRLVLEGRLAPGASSGLYLRGPRDGRNPAFGGYEIQLASEGGEGTEASEAEPRAAWDRIGSLWGVLAADTGATERTVGPFLLEVLLEGDRLAVALDSKALYDVRLSELSMEPPYEERARSGYIGLQRVGSPGVEGDRLLFVRRLAVQPLRGRTADDDEDESG